MITINRIKGIVFLCLIVFCDLTTHAQDALNWSKDGNAYYAIENNDIVQYTLPSNSRTVLIKATQLIPPGQSSPLEVELWKFSPDGKKVLVYTESKRVWRINTRGNYYVLDLSSGQLKKLGKGRPESSLMFAQFSPDGSKVAYVSDYNVYVEDLASGKITPVTTDGNRKFINGTFDWVYEEEFACRDGIRWSPDSKSVLYWQLDARATRDFYMINYTDSVYSHVIPVEYPKVGEQPSACRLAVANIETGKSTWLNVEGDPREHYIVRAEFIPGTTDVLLQQLNRRQNVSKLIRANSLTGQTAAIFQEEDKAWIEVYGANPAQNPYSVDFKHTFNWIAGGKEFLWESEKDGWQHTYKIGIDGKKQLLVTPGEYDVITMMRFDEKENYIYYYASPSNATQKYLYRIKADGKSKPQLLTPSDLQGTHDYDISPNCKFAVHYFSNTFTSPLMETVSLPNHKALNPNDNIASNIQNARTEKTTEFFKVKTQDGVEMDGWMVKPLNFDPAKKYPVLFMVYAEPASAKVTDQFMTAYPFLYDGDLRKDGYIYISVDNRGTPVPKGREFRKAIYGKIGQVNIRDQAMAAKEIMKWNFVDKDRIGVWGWSGGGSTTLNLLFQYPDIYKMGIAIAPVTNLLTYDNIYEERYMGLPQERMDDYIKGSPLTHAKNLKGDLLLVHGTGDDNVHYQNSEMLINELIRNKKVFQFMPYPNRTHSINEGGKETTQHLKKVYTAFLRQHLPGGGK